VLNQNRLAICILTVNLAVCDCDASKKRNMLRGESRGRYLLAGFFLPARRNTLADDVAGPENTPTRETTTPGIHPKMSKREKGDKALMSRTERGDRDLYGFSKGSTATSRNWHTHRVTAELARTSTNLSDGVVKERTINLGGSARSWSKTTKLETPRHERGVG